MRHKNALIGVVLSWPFQTKGVLFSKRNFCTQNSNLIDHHLPNKAKFHWFQSIGTARNFYVLTFYSQLFSSENSIACQTQHPWDWLKDNPWSSVRNLGVIINERLFMDFRIASLLFTFPARSLQSVERRLFEELLVPCAKNCTILDFIRYFCCWIIVMFIEKYVHCAIPFADQVGR